MAIASLQSDLPVFSFRQVVRIIKDVVENADYR
jgi:hypothetical protein